MSKWVDIRDAIVETLKLDTLTEEVKQNAAKAIVNEVMPSVTEAATSLADKLKEQASSETGWVKIRDAFIFPLLIQGALYAVETVLTKTLSKT